jgi:hypothetical protein
MHKDGTACSHEWPRSAHLYTWLAMVALPVLAGVVSHTWWGALPLGALPPQFPWIGVGALLGMFYVAYLARPRSMRQ